MESVFDIQKIWQTHNIVQNNVLFAIAIKMPPNPKFWRRTVHWNRKVDPPALMAQICRVKSEGGLLFSTNYSNAKYNVCTF